MTVFTVALTISMSFITAGGEDDAWAARRQVNIHQSRRMRIVNFPEIDVDERKLQQAGVRKIEGDHITLYTDLQQTEGVDDLPEVFDHCFPQWCEYFELDPQEEEDWHVKGFLMKDREKFRRLGVIPPYVPDFRHGYSVKSACWMMEQPNRYRRRQLMIHEGTHAFMLGKFGSCGPPWYMEGLAEMISTFDLDDDEKVVLNHMPAAREEAPMWGRVPLVREAYDSGKRIEVDDIVHMTGIIETEDYARCWAFVYFMEHHPRYRERFRTMPDHVLDIEFNRLFHVRFRKDWDQLREDWCVFLHELEYGHDVVSTVIDPAIGDREPGASTTFEVQADAGWQNSGIHVKEGEEYVVESFGRFQVDDDPKPWISEPNGVTMRYYRGQPIGKLMAAVRADERVEGRDSGLTRPIGVGLRSTIKAPETGTVFFRINESSGELNDNRGKLTARVRPAE